MLDSIVEVLKTVDHSEKLLGALKKAVEKELLVGIPEDENDRPDEEITNAQLAYIHEHGSPINNIPPRPFLTGTIEDNRDTIAKQQGKVLTAIIEGGDAEAELEKTGILVTNLIKKKFTDNDWPPNAPATIAKKGSDKPLIDKGVLRKAVTYVVRDAKE